MTRNFFITATGTDIGKTFVTCALIHQLRQAGKSVSAVKPIISGMANTADSNDLHQLANALGNNTPSKLAHTAYQQPLAPDMAARLEATAPVDLAEIVNFSKPPSNSDFHFIEGVGGVAVPLNSQETTLDWMSALACPTILVAGHYLGSISHTITAIETLKSRNIPLHAIIINQIEPPHCDVNQTITSISHFSNTPIFALSHTNHWQEAANLLHILT